jgi:hypothetical protein
MRVDDYEDLASRALGPQAELRALLAERRDEILRAAERRGAGNVRLFGSAARGEAGPGSDVDLLVELGPEVSLLDLGGLHSDLERILGRAVDVVPEEELKPAVRDRVLGEAVPCGLGGRDRDAVRAGARLLRDPP